MQSANAPTKLNTIANQPLPKMNGNVANIKGPKVMDAGNHQGIFILTSKLDDSNIVRI